MFGFIRTSFDLVKDLIRNPIVFNSNDAPLRPTLPGTWPMERAEAPRRRYRHVKSGQEKRRHQRRTQQAHYDKQNYVGPSQCAQAINLALEDFRRGMNAAAFLAGQDAIHWPSLIQIHINIDNNGADHRKLFATPNNINNRITTGAKEAVHELIRTCEAASAAVSEVQDELLPLRLDLDALDQLYDNRLRRELAAAEAQWYASRNAVKDLCWENMLADRRLLKSFGMADRVRNLETQNWLQADFLRREEDLKGQLREQCRRYEAMLAAEKERVREEMREAVEKAREEGYRCGVAEKCKRKRQREDEEEVAYRSQKRSRDDPRMPWE